MRRSGESRKWPRETPRSVSSFSPPLESKHPVSKSGLDGSLRARMFPLRRAETTSQSGQGVSGDYRIRSHEYYGRRVGRIPDAQTERPLLYAGGGSRLRRSAGGPASRPGVEHLANLAGQKVRGERFLKVGHSGVEHAVMSDHAIRVPGHIEHADPGLDVGDALGQLASAHLRHDDVGEEEVDGMIVAANEIERLPAVARLENVVAVHPQHFTGQQPHGSIVFDEEHCF